MADLEDSENPDLSTTLTSLSSPCSVFIAGAAFASLTFAVLTFKLSRLLRATDSNKQPIACLSEGCVNSLLSCVLCLAQARQSHYSQLLNQAGNGTFSKTYDKSVPNSRHSVRRTMKRVDNGTLSVCRKLNDGSMKISNCRNASNKNEKHNSHVTCTQRQFLVFNGCILPLEVPAEVTETQSSTAKYGVSTLTTDTKQHSHTCTNVISTTDIRNNGAQCVDCEGVFCETSQTIYRKAAISQTSHGYHATPQTNHRDATTPQTNHRDATTPQTRHRDTTTPQTRHRGATTPQTNHRAATTPQTNHRDATTPQTRHRDTTTPQTRHRGATTLQTSHRKATTPQTSHSYGATSLSTDTTFCLGRRVPASFPTTSMTVESRCKIPPGPLLSSVCTSVPKGTTRASVCHANNRNILTSWICSSASVSNDTGPACKTPRKKLKTNDHVTLLSYSMEMLNKCRPESVSQYGKSTNALMPCLYEEKKNDQRQDYFHRDNNGDIHKQRRITYRQCSAARPSKQDVPTFILHTRTAPSDTSNIDSKSRSQQQSTTAKCCTRCHCSNMGPRKENEPHTSHCPRGSLFACSNELKQLIQTTITDMQKYKPVQATRDKTEAGVCHHPSYLTRAASGVMRADDSDTCQKGKRHCDSTNIFLDKRAEYDHGPISSRVSSHNYCNNAPTNNKRIQQSEACVENNAANNKHNTRDRRLQYNMTSSQSKIEMKTSGNCKLNVDIPHGTKLSHIQVNDWNNHIHNHNHIRQNDASNHIHNKFGLQDVISKPLEQCPDEGEGRRGRSSSASRRCVGIRRSSKPSDESAKHERKNTCRQKAGECPNPFVTIFNKKGARTNHYISNSKRPRDYKTSEASKIVRTALGQNKMSNTEIQIDTLDNLAYAVSDMKHLKPGRRCRTHRSILEGVDNITSYKSQSSHFGEIAHPDTESCNRPTHSIASSVYPASNKQYIDLKKPHRNNSHREQVINSVIKRYATGTKRRIREARKCSCHKTRLKTRKQSNRYEKSTTTARHSLLDKLDWSVSPRKSNKFVKNTENRDISRERIDLQNDLEYATIGSSNVCYRSSRCKQETTPLGITGYTNRNCSTIPCEANAISDAFILMKYKHNSSESVITNSTRCASAASVYLAQILSSASTQTHYSASYRLEDKCMVILGKPETSRLMTGQAEKSHLQYHSQTTSSDLRPVPLYGSNSPPSAVWYSSDSPPSVCRYGGNSHSSESYCSGNSLLVESQHAEDSSVKVRPYKGDSLMSAFKYGGSILPSVEYDRNAVWSSRERLKGDIKQSNNILSSRENPSETTRKSYDGKRLNCYLLNNNNFPADQRRQLADGKRCCYQLDSTLKHKARVRFKQSLEEIDNEEKSNTDTDIKTVICREFLERTHDHSINDVQFLKHGDRTEYSSDLCSGMTTSIESFRAQSIADAKIFAETKLNNIGQRVHVRGRPLRTNTHNKTPTEMAIACNRLQAGGMRSPSPITLDSEQISYLEIIPKNGICPGFRLSELDTSRIPIEGKLIRPNKTPRNVKQQKQQQQQQQRNGRNYPSTTTPSLSSSSISEMFYACKPVPSMSPSCESSSTSNTYPSTLTDSSSTSLVLPSEGSTGVTRLPRRQVVMRDAGGRHRILDGPENKRSAEHACYVPHYTLPLSTKATLGLDPEAGCVGDTLVHEGCKSDWVSQRNSELMHVTCRSVNTADKSVRMNADKQVSCNIRDEMVDKDAQTSTYLNEQHTKCSNKEQYSTRKSSHISLGFCEKNTSQKYQGSSANTKACQDKLNKPSGDSLTRTAGQIVQPIVDMSKGKLGPDPGFLDNNRKVESPVSKHTPQSEDSGFMFQLKVDNNPNHTSHIRLEKRCSKNQCSGFEFQDLIRALKILGPYSQSDVKDHQTESPHRKLESSMWNAINTENKRPDVKEKSVQCTQKMTVRPKLNDVLKHSKKKKWNRLKCKSTISKTGAPVTRQQLKHIVSPGKSNIKASVQSYISPVSLSWAAGRILECSIDRVRVDSEHVYKNDNMCSIGSGKIPICELGNETGVSGVLREYKKPPLKLTRNEDRPEAKLLLRATKCQKTCLQSRDKLYHLAPVDTLILPEKNRLSSANENHNLGFITQTMQWSDTRTKNNNKITCKTLSVTNASDGNTTKHKTLQTEAGRHGSATSRNNYLRAQNDKVPPGRKPAFKSRIPVLINHKKVSVNPKPRQQLVNCFSKILTHMGSSDNNFPNCSLNYRLANHSRHVTNRKATVPCEDRVWNPRYRTVTSQTSRMSSSNYNPFLSERRLPIKKQYTCSQNNLNRVRKTTKDCHLATCNLGATGTSQMVGRYCSSNNCHHPARDCSNHTFTKDNNGQKQVGRLKSIRVKEPEKQPNIDTLPGTAGETRRNVTAVDISHNLYGNKPVRTYATTGEGRTEGRTVTGIKRPAVHLVRVSSKHRVKPAKLQSCSANQQPETTTRGDNIQLGCQMSQQAYAGRCDGGIASLGVDSTISDRYKADMFRDCNKIPPNVTKTNKVPADKDNMSSPVQPAILVEEQNIHTDSDLNRMVSHPILDLSILPSAVYKRNKIGLCSDLESDCACFLSCDHPGENCTLCNSFNPHDTSRTKSTGSKFKKESQFQTCNFSTHQPHKLAQKFNSQDMKTTMFQKSPGTDTSHFRGNCAENILAHNLPIDSLLRLSPETEASSLEEMECSITNNVHASSVAPGISHVSNTNTLSWVCVSTTDDVSASFVFDFPSDSRSHNILR